METIRTSIFGTETSIALVIPGYEPHPIPKNWRWVRIDSICKIFTGNSINERVKEKKYTGMTHGLVYIATKDIGFDSSINYDTNISIPKEDGFKVAPQNSTLLCIEGGSAGRKIGFLSQDVCFVNKLCAFVPSKRIFPKYLYYLIQSDTFKQQFEEKKHGLIGGVSLKEISSIYIPLVPFQQQIELVAKIESLFSKLDDAKEKAQEVLDNFEHRKASILHKAFTGELTAKWRKENCVNIDSWKQKSISECCKLSSGGTPSRRIESYYTGNIPWIKTGEINWNVIFSSEEKISQEAIENSSAKIYNPGAVLVAMYGMGVTRGKAAILGVKAATNQAVCVLQPQDFLFNRFLFYFFMSNYWEFREQAVGGNQLNLSATIIGKFKINLPSLSEQKQISKNLDTLIEKELLSKQAAEMLVDKIDMMKKSVLARAFSGKLGTNNDPNDESVDGLLKKILSDKVNEKRNKSKPKNARIVIPDEIDNLLQTDLERKIIKLFYKNEKNEVPEEDVMSVSSRSFDNLDAVQSLENKKLIKKNKNGAYKLLR